MADLVIGNPKRVAKEPQEIPAHPLARFAPADNLYDAIRSDVAPLGGVEFMPLIRHRDSEPPFSDIDDEPNDGE
jgi:hypothetical protein